MIRGIHHAAISTGNMERSLGFYRDLLGFEVVADFGWPTGFEPANAILGLEDSAARAVMLKAGNAFIELFQFETPTPTPGDPGRPVCDHGITHVCIDVTDVDSEYERLKKAGVKFHCPPQDLGDSRVTYGRDPDGNVFELQEVSDPKSAFALKL